MPARPKAGVDADLADAALAADATKQDPADDPGPFGDPQIAAGDGALGGVGRDGGSVGVFGEADGEEAAIGGDPDRLKGRNIGIGREPNARRR